EALAYPPAGLLCGPQPHVPSVTFLITRVRVGDPAHFPQGHQFAGGRLHHATVLVQSELVVVPSHLEERGVADDAHGFASSAGMIIAEIHQPVLLAREITGVGSAVNCEAL